MKIKTIKIKNFMGIERLELSTGTVNIFSGQNGSGKTSVLEAIKHVMSHNHEPSRIGKFGDAAEVTLSFDNGDIYKMKTKKTATTWDFKNAKGEPILKSAAHLQSLVDFLALDPIKFITQTPKEQAITFLESVPMSVTAEELTAIGVPSAFMQTIDLNQHALRVIGDEKGGVYKRVYDERTLVNRIAKENKTSAAELDKAVVNVPNIEQAVRVYKDLQAQIEKQEQEYASARESRLQIKSTIEAGAEQEREAREKLIIAKYNQLLREADAYKVHELSISTAKYDNDMAVARNMDTEAAEAAEVKYKSELAQLYGELGRAEKNYQEAQKVNGIIQLRTNYEKKADEYETKSAQYTEILDRLAALRTKLAATSPLPGVEISDSGTLQLNGIPFEITNLAQQIEIALKLGQLRQRGECGIMIVDNLEHFDSKHLDSVLRALYEAASQCNLQIFGAKVDGGELLRVSVLDSGGESLEEEDEAGI